MKIEGAYVALITPFDRQNRLDEIALRRLLKRQLNTGISGVVPCGTTGESATLNHREYLRVIEICLEELHGKIHVIPGVSGADTQKVIEIAGEVEHLGADALLVLTPYYTKPTQDGLFAHYSAVSRAVKLPIIVYNIPGRTAVNMLPQTLSRLVKACPNIVGLKDGTCNLDQASETILLLPPSFSVLASDDSLALPILSVGGRGMISVIANLLPRQTAELCASFLKGDSARARKIHLKLFPLMRTLFLETNPIPVKAAAEMMGLCNGRPRLPLLPLSSRYRASLKQALKELHLP